MATHDRFCALCRARRPVILLHTIRGHQVVRCRICDLVFTAQDNQSADAVVSLYSKEYFEGGAPDGYANYAASEPTLRREARRLLKRVRRHRLAGALLEIGCAYGFFLLEAGAFFTVTGLEVSGFAAEQARRRGLDVVHTTIEDFASPASFEVICLFDCIEHMLDPFESLGRIHALLAPGGVVALTTGDIASVYAKISGVRWRLMTPPQHQFFFSRSTMTRMLASTGFEVVEVSHPWKLVPVHLALYQIHPRVKALAARFVPVKAALLVNLFDAMFVVAKKSVGARPHGDNP